MRILMVGDMHVTVDELEDAGQAVLLVKQIVEDHRPDVVVFMGDQHHNHAVVRIEVVDFWERALQELCFAGMKRNAIFMLVGNHDRSTNQALEMNSLVYDCNIIRRLASVCIVPRPYKHVSVDDPNWPSSVYLMPWIPDTQFAEAIKDIPDGAVLLCHQTFNGAQYETGFYAPDGVDPKLVARFSKVFSGHIHKPQSFGNIHYIGAPRWRLMSDANEERAIVLFDTETNVAQYFDTGEYCTPIFKIADHESGAGVFPPAYLKHLKGKSPERGKKYVDIVGTAEYCEKRKFFWEQQNFSVATFPARPKVEAVSEAKGVMQALQTHLDEFVPPFGTPLETLKKMVSERIHV